MNYDNNNQDNMPDDDWLTAGEAVDYVTGANVPTASPSTDNINSEGNDDPYGDYDPAKDRSLNRSSVGIAPHTSGSPLSYYNNYTEANVAMGTLGAIIGGGIGGFMWYFLADNRLLNVFLGAAMIYLVMQGYKLLGKKLDHNGLWICSILAVVIALVAHVLCWARRMQTEIAIGAYIMSSLFVENASEAYSAVTEEYDFSYCLSHVFDYVNDGFRNQLNFYGILIIGVITGVITAKQLYRPMSR